MAAAKNISKVTVPNDMRDLITEKPRRGMIRKRRKIWVCEKSLMFLTSDLA